MYFRSSMPTKSCTYCIELMFGQSQEFGSRRLQNVTKTDYGGVKKHCSIHICLVSRPAKSLCPGGPRPPRPPQATVFHMCCYDWLGYRKISCLGRGTHKMPIKFMVVEKHTVLEPKPAKSVSRAPEECRSRVSTPSEV
jgi:hypothetical protein